MTDQASSLVAEPRIFLSYAHSDQSFVDRLASDLRTLGIGVWVDTWELKAGDSLIEKIEQGVSAVDFVIPVVSSASARSNWVQREIKMASMRAATEGRGLIVPVRIDDTPLPAPIKGLLYADFTDYTAGLKALLATIYPYGIVRSQVRQIVRDAQQIGHQVPRFFGANIDEAIERKLVPTTDLNFSILMWSALENWLSACTSNGTANIGKWDQFELLLNFANDRYNDSEDGTYGIPWRFAGSHLQAAYQWDRLSYSDIRVLDTSPIIRSPNNSIQFASPGALLFFVGVRVCLLLNVLKPILLERIPTGFRRSYSPEEIFHELDRRPFPPSLTQMILDMASMQSERLRQLLGLQVQDISGSSVQWPVWSSGYRNANLLQLLRAYGERQLNGVDLSGLDLTRADFVGADLRGAKLRGATLREATFVGARLDDADISGANITKTEGLIGSCCRSVAAVSSDPLVIAAGCDGGGIDIRNIAEKTSKVVHTHGGRVESVFWDEDRQALISVSRRGVAEIHAEFRTLANTRLIFDWASAAWDKAILWHLSPDHYYVGAAEIRDSAVHWLRKKHSRAITCADYRAMGRILAMGTWSGVLLLLHGDQGTMEVLNMPEPDNLGRAHWDTIWRVRFGSQHPWLASSGARGDPRIKVWDFERRGLVWSIGPGEDGPVWDFVFGNGDAELFIAPREGPLARVTPTARAEKSASSPFKVITVGEPTPSDPWNRGVDIIRADTRNESPVRSLALGRGGQQLASGHEDGSITLWDTTTLQSITEWKAHDATVADVTYASADKLVASVGSDGSIAVGVCEPTDGAFGSVVSRWASGGSCRGLRFAHTYTDDGDRSSAELLATLAARCASKRLG
jgi:WD40 repeat protein